ncbi:glycosyltransferase family 4 protein [Pseudomonadota bacterium]
MKVAYFSNQFSDIRGHGIARYARELFESLQASRSSLEITPVSAWSGLDEQALGLLKAETGLHVLPWGRKVTPLAWTFLNAPKIESSLPKPVDLVHSVALGYPLATRKPFVVTVHDIGPLSHPEYFSPGTAIKSGLHTQVRIMKRSLAQMVRKADAIICVSQSTADELESYVGSTVADRISVIHEGISPHFVTPPDDSGAQLLNKLGIGDTPFILSAGAISPRKNTLSIIKALARLADVIPHHLVLVGGDGWSMEKVYEELGSSAIADRVHLTGYVSDEQLKGLFGAASAYLHPSLYEGFGLTLLEAMAQGCPVVTSNVYSLPEVAGDAALLVDPASVDEIADAIEAVCTNDALAADLAARGRERVKAFSWDDCAKGVIKVYQNL